MNLEIALPRRENVEGVCKLCSVACFVCLAQQCILEVASCEQFFVTLVACTYVSFILGDLHNAAAAGRLLFSFS